ncbi:MAG: hypothetical protein ABI741_04995 [Ferruginibacter sp.]
MLQIIKTMQTILVLHNILRWAILVFGVWTLLNALSGVMSKRPYSVNDNRSNLFFMISCDIQLLLGLVLYFSNSWFDTLKSGMGNAMKVPMLRFFTIEHSLMMIIAWILVHVGRTSVKRAATDAGKHRKMLLFFGLALLLILAAIPWPFRTEIARPLFRWFN